MFQIAGKMSLGSIMKDISAHFPMGKDQVLNWYKAQLAEVRAKYPDLRNPTRAHPKVREFAALFNSPETAYDDMLTWLIADGLEEEASK